MDDDGRGEVYRFVGEQDPGLPYEKMRQSNRVQTKPGVRDYVNQLIYDFYSDSDDVFQDEKGNLSYRSVQTRTNPARIHREKAQASRYPVDPEMGKDIENDARRIKLMSALKELETRSKMLYHPDLGWEKRFPDAVP